MAKERLMSGMINSVNRLFDGSGTSLFALTARLYPDVFYVQTNKGYITLELLIDETEYLLSAPANRSSLLKSIEQSKAGLCVERDLIEL